jgi:Glycosyl hydrolase catalytic core
MSTLLPSVRLLPHHWPNLVVMTHPVVVDWYDTNSTAFIEYITDFHNTFQRPIWVTEWACQSFTGAPQCSQKHTNDLMATTQEFMDKTDWVERYSWFGAMTDPVISPVDSLLDKDGDITPLGKQYIGKISQQENDASVYKILHPSTHAADFWSSTDSSDVVDGGNNNTNATFPQIGMGYPGVLPPPIWFRTLGRATASIGFTVAVAVIAFC